MVCLTALLVEAAFFTQTSADIPSTSDLKLVDIWFVFCIVALFLVMVGIVVINKILMAAEDKPSDAAIKRAWDVPVQEESLLAHRVNAVCVVVIPFLLAIFVVGYFVFAATYRADILNY
ncbi:uncharacterized protein LOC122258337 [Penaeus japonicus]|uniref:uncharacterized protein LOC122258337 n=1 Tax=Penaeus japonicus TaxID=27405 RepID=UPI001C7113E9|nr:uncharacterized protein LOC122258337 [Penaeus japonicus]